MPKLIFRTYDVVQTGWDRGTPRWGVEEKLNDVVVQRYWADLSYIEAQSRCGVLEEVLRRFSEDNNLEARLQAGDEAINTRAALENEVLDLRAELRTQRKDPLPTETRNAS